jgi:hypothetical protein
MYTGLGKLSIQSEKWRSGVVLFLNVKFCYEIQHFWVWHSAKEFIAHRLFKSVEELESLLHQLLNEGGLIIKWDRKLKNKGNSVNAI